MAGCDPVVTARPMLLPDRQYSDRSRIGDYQGLTDRCAGSA